LTITAGMFRAGYSRAVRINEMNTTLAEMLAQRDARMVWWRDAKFRVFIHWGIYSMPAGFYHGILIPSICDWTMCNAKITMTEYQRRLRFRQDGFLRQHLVLRDQAGRNLSDNYQLAVR